MAKVRNSLIRVGSYVFFAWISFFSQPVLETYSVPARMYAGGLALALVLSVKHLCNRTDVFLWGFIVFLLAGIVNAIQFNVAFTTYLSIAAVLAAVFYIGKGLFSTAENRAGMAAVMCVCSFIVACIALLELYAGRNSIYETLVDNPYYKRYTMLYPRPMSTLFNPAILGSYLLGCLPFHIYFLRKKKASLRIVAACSSLLCAWVIVLTFSRGVFLGLAAVLFFYLWKAQKKKLLVLLSVCLVLFVGVSSFQSNPNVNRFGFKRMFIGSYDSVISPYRIARIEMTARILRGHPVAGIGFNHFRLRFNEYADVGNKGREAYEFMVPDNMYLAFLSESGLVGTAGFLIFIFFLLRDGFRRFSMMQNGLEKQMLLVCLSACAGLLVNMGAYELFYWDTPFMLFCLICGFIQGITDQKPIAC